MGTGREVGDFKSWENGMFSLFNAELYIDPEELRRDNLGDLGFIREADLNWRATRLLLIHLKRRENQPDFDYQKILDYITHAHHLNPNSIHMWANKGVFHLSQSPPEYELAIAAKSQLDECSLNEQALREAKIQFAYWSYGWGAYSMHDRNIKITATAWEICEAEFEKGLGSNPENHYMYMRVLEMEARNRPTYDRLNNREKDQWLSKVITGLIDQMIILAGYQDAQYELEIWNMLMDVHYLPYCHKQLEREKTKLKKIDSAIKNKHNLAYHLRKRYDIEACIMRMLAIRDDQASRVVIRPQFYYRIGSFYLYIGKFLAVRQNDKERKLKSAIEMVDHGFKCTDKNDSWNENEEREEKKVLGLKVASDSNMNLWALSFYGEGGGGKILVDKAFKNQYLTKEERRREEVAALVFYSSKDRKGAEEEAKTLHSSLTKVAGHVTCQEWSDVCDLEGKVQRSIRSLDCSLLFFCVMSHGKMGELVGPDGHTLPVNDLIHQIRSLIPERVELVLLVQACQSHDIPIFSEQDTSQTDAARASPEVMCMHIDLVQPNTVLLKATVTGGYAVRGAYTTAMASEISKADGIKDIHGMHMNAVKAMRNNHEQIPEIRSTAQDDVVLPESVEDPVTIKDIRPFSHKNIMRFLGSEFFYQLDESSPGGPYLVKAYEQLNDMKRKGSFVITSRIRYLLGHPHDEIEEEIKAEMEGTFKREHQKVLHTYYYGRFLEATNRDREAIVQFKKSIEIQMEYQKKRGDTYHLRAQYGIKRLQ